MAPEGSLSLYYHKKGQIGVWKWKGHNWSLSEGKASGKVGLGMSGMQPDTR